MSDTAAQETKAYKVSKGDTAADVVGKVVAKFEGLSAVKERYQLVPEGGGKPLKDSKHMGDLKLSDNV